MILQYKNNKDIEKFLETHTISEMLIFSTHIQLKED